MRKPLFWAIAASLAMLACACISQQGRNELAQSMKIFNDKADGKKLFDNYRAMEGEIVFYGKVVDQHGEPVANASVKVSVPTVEKLGMPMLNREKIIITGNDGRFEVSNKTYSMTHLKGCYLYVKDLTKEGYEKQLQEWGKKEITMFSFSNSNTARFCPDAANPIVYTMRKKELPEVFLVHSLQLCFGAKINSDGKPTGYDFIKCVAIGNMNNLMLNGQPLFCDFLFNAALNKDGTTWTVVLSSGDPKGGIIASEQLLYEAPATGYQAKYTFIAEDRNKPVKAKYIYLKSRDPAIYTRLEIEGIVVQKEFMYLDVHSLTNPYGDRNLEWAANLPYKVTAQLTREAETAFRHDKRPSPPDLQKLIREVKEQAKKEKNK